MARPIKAELDYFPLDCRLNDRMKLIEAEFGLEGFAIVIKLYQKIYGGKGYYCDFNDEVMLLFAKEINAGGNIVSEVIKGALRRGIFSSAMYEKYGILTSERVQKTYLEAASRREVIHMDERYLLVSHTLLPENVSINGVNVNRNPVNECDNPQKKRKERKRKEKKLNHSKREENNPPLSMNEIMECCRRNGFVYLDPEKFFRWCSERSLPLKTELLAKWDREDKEALLRQRGYISPQDIIIMMQKRGYSEADAAHAMIEARKRELKEARSE